nr:hypothetical protein [uncultured Desulfobacter sp.]
MCIKTVKTLLITVIFFSLFLGVALVQAQETVEVIGHQYSPYQNKDQSGFQNELVRETFKAAGLMADITIAPPLRTVNQFYTAKFAVCADGETLNDDEKNKALDVRKKTYWNVPIGLMYYKPNLTPAQISQLETVKSLSDIDPGLTILSYGGYNPFNDAGFKGKVFIKSNSPEQTMAMVKGGRNELGFEVLGVTPYFTKKDNPEELDNWAFLNYWLYFPQYIAFNGSHPKGAFYEEKFNQGLSTIKKNGVYVKIYERFYGKKNVPKSAIDDPDGEIRDEDQSKIVEDNQFDLAKFLRQVRDRSGFIVKFVD